jgi:hypothetical protein
MVPPPTQLRTGSRDAQLEPQDTRKGPLGLVQCPYIATGNLVLLEERRFSIVLEREQSAHGKHADTGMAADGRLHSDSPCIPMKNINLYASHPSKKSTANGLQT